MNVTRREFMVGVAGLGFGILLDGCAGARSTQGGAGLATEARGR